MNQLSVKECISFGWETFKSRPWFFVGITAVLFLIDMIVQIPSEITKDPQHPITAIAIVGLIVSFLLSLLVSMGRTAFYLRAHDAPEAASLGDIWHPRSYLKFLGMVLLIGIGVIVGLILLIIPGLIFAIASSLAIYLVIEKDMGPIDAIKESFRITKGNRISLFVLGLALVGINILGMIALLVGLLVSVPVSALAVVHAYRKLSAQGAPVAAEISSPVV